MNSASSEGKGRMTKIAPNPSPRRLRVCAFGVGRPGVLHTLGQDVAKITPHTAAPAPRTLGPLPQNRVRFPLSCPRPSVRLPPPKAGCPGIAPCPITIPGAAPLSFLGFWHPRAPPQCTQIQMSPSCPPRPLTSFLPAGTEEGAGGGTNGGDIFLGQGMGTPNRVL